jgi:hypothetical protein
LAQGASLYNRSIGQCSADRVYQLSVPKPASQTFFGDIALAFTAVNGNILLVRLADADVPPRVGDCHPFSWVLDVADLVTEIRRDIALPVPHQLMVILLFVNDFCLIASSPSQLLAVMQIAQTSFENNRLTLGEIKSHGIPRDPRHTTSR